MNTIIGSNITKELIIQTIEIVVWLIIILITNDATNEPICNTNELKDNIVALLLFETSEFIITPSEILNIPKLKYIIA